jgi:hypothetical protein
VKLKVARALCCACVYLYGCAGECVDEAQQGVQGVGQSKSALGRGAWRVRGCCNTSIGLQSIASALSQSQASRALPALWVPALILDHNGSL